jgi:hypothetical protein
MTEETYNYTFYMIHRKGRNIIDIYDEEDGEHYIGSTKYELKRRVSKHTTSYNSITHRSYNYPVYSHIRLTGGFEEWEFSVIEKHKYITKKDALIHERWLIELYGSQLNSQPPIKTQTEQKLTKQIWVDKNREQINTNHREYVNKNKDRIKETHKKHRDSNREKLRERNAKYRLENKEKIKVYKDQYTEENKEKIKVYRDQYNKQYYEKNKEKCREQARERARAKRKLKKEQNI